VKLKQNLSHLSWGNRLVIKYFQTRSPIKIKRRKAAMTFGEIYSMSNVTPIKARQPTVACTINALQSYITPLVK
jgi:hypothetical protein